nr:NADH dehydrogenase subunit 3 [Sida crystallina]
MLYFILHMLILSLISFILFTLALTLGKKLKMNREKASPFECGFDPNSNLRVPFSLRFFLITVIFLIFDVEIVLLLPSAFSYFSVASYWFITLNFFLIILILGLAHEWNQGALEWAK